MNNQEESDTEGQAQSHPAKTLHKDDDKDKDNSFNDDAHTFPKVNWSNAIQENMTTMSSITPQEVDTSAIQHIRAQSRQHFNEFTLEDRVCCQAPSEKSTEDNIGKSLALNHPKNHWTNRYLPLIKI